MHITEVVGAIPKHKFVPGKGFIGEPQAIDCIDFEWEDGKPIMTRGSRGLEPLYCEGLRSQDIAIIRFTGSAEIPAIHRWARLVIPKNATVEIKTSKNPVCRIFLYQEIIVLKDLHGINNRVQLLAAMEEVYAILCDEQLMQLAFMRLLNYEPCPFTSQHVEDIKRVLDGFSKVREKYGRELGEISRTIQSMIGKSQS